jgi:Ni/Co efflux regulator RcnB
MPYGTEPDNSLVQTFIAAQQLAAQRRRSQLEEAAMARDMEMARQQAEAAQDAASAQHRERQFQAGILSGNPIRAESAAKAYREQNPIGLLQFKRALQGEPGKPPDLGDIPEFQKLYPELTPGSPEFAARYNKWKREGQRPPMQINFGDKPVGESTAKDIGEYGTAISGLKNIKDMWQKEYGDNSLVDAAMNWFSERVPGSKENVYVARKTLVTQLAGRLLEGGVLKEAEYSRYMQMIPGPSDTGTAGAAKWDSIISGLEGALASRNQALTAAGYKPVTMGEQSPGVTLDFANMSDEELARIAGGG